MAEQVLINGFLHDSSSCLFKINGKPVAFLELNYEQKKEPGKIRGSGAQRRGKTRGDYEASGSMKLLIDDGEAFENDLQGPLLDTHFEGSVAFEREGRNHYHELVGCLATSDKTAVANGNGEAIAYEYTLDIELIVKNGRLPISGAKR